jgi:hypothetical protein
MRSLVALVVVAGCSEYNPGSALEPPDPPPIDEVPDGWALEEFAGAESSTADVLVFADTSCSMVEELQTLGETITPFVEPTTGSSRRSRAAPGARPVGSSPRTRRGTPTGSRTASWTRTGTRPSTRWACRTCSS